MSISRKCAKAESDELVCLDTVRKPLEHNELHIHQADRSGPLGLESWAEQWKLKTISD